MANEKKKENIPGHVGIIIDGNRRWARERNLPDFEGHLKGYEKLKKIPEWFFSRGIDTLSVFCFSTENWRRSREEVNYLMKLLKEALNGIIKVSSPFEFKVLVSGRIDELPGDLPEACYEAMDKTKASNGGILNLCINYGGRAEIIDAIKKIVKNKMLLGQIHEGMLRKCFYHGELSDPDIIVRTSGEERLSGFQLWQSAYSELLFLRKYWPEFEESDVEVILEEYAGRKRRFGGGE